MFWLDRAIPGMEWFRWMVRGPFDRLIQRVFPPPSPLTPPFVLMDNGDTVPIPPDLEVCTPSFTAWYAAEWRKRHPRPIIEPEPQEPSVFCVLR